MAITLEWGWWLLPAALTLGFAAIPILMNREAGDDSLGIGAALSIIAWLLFWALPSLVAWLVWAVLR